MVVLNDYGCFKLDQCYELSKQTMEKQIFFPDYWAGCLTESRKINLMTQNTTTWHFVKPAQFADYHEKLLGDDEKIFHLTIEVNNCKGQPCPVVADRKRLM